MEKIDPLNILTLNEKNKRDPLGIINGKKQVPKVPQKLNVVISPNEIKKMALDTEAIKLILEKINKAVDNTTNNKLLNLIKEMSDILNKTLLQENRSDEIENITSKIIDTMITLNNQNKNNELDIYKKLDEVVNTIFDAIPKDIEELEVDNLKYSKWGSLESCRIKVIRGD